MPLPLLILELAVGYLDTSGLLQVCLVSKDVHWIAAGCLYRQILFTEENVLVARKEMKHRNTNKATVVDLVDEEKIEKLVDTVLLNKYLGALIESVIISPALDSEDDEWIFLLLQSTQLKSFHYKSLTDIDSGESQTIERLSMYIPVLAKSTPFTRLTELNIFYEGLEDDRKFYEELAYNLIELDIQQILRKLRFIHTPMEDFLYIPWMNQDDDIPPTPEWSCFFNAFALNGIKLDLTDLTLDREFYGDLNEVAEIIKLVVVLGNLKTLSIRVIEDVEVHEHTLLEMLCQNTPLLTSLSIEKAKMNHSQLHSIVRTLREAIPNQLTKLWVRLNLEQYMNPEPLRQAILSYQHNLVFFRIEDGCFLHLIDLPCTTGEIFSLWILNVIECEESIGEFTLREFDIDEPLSYVSEEKAHIVKTYTEEILKMQKYHSIFNGAAENLPFLTKCYLQGFWLNMKTRALICHEGEVPLE